MAIKCKCNGQTQTVLAKYVRGHGQEGKRR
jgi:hypothetical protein